MNQQQQAPTNPESTTNDLDLDSFDGPLMFRLLQAIHLACQNIIDNSHTWEKFIRLIEPHSFREKYKTRIFHEYTTSREQLQIIWEDELRRIVSESDIRRKLNAIDLHIKLDDHAGDNVVMYPTTTTTTSANTSQSDLVTQTWKTQSIHNKMILSQNMQRLLSTMKEENNKLEQQNDKHRKKLQEYGEQLKQTASQFQAAVNVLQEQWDSQNASQTLTRFQPVDDEDEDEVM